MVQKKNVIYLVGAGPNDPKLLTMQTHHLLQKADIVVYDPNGHTSIGVGKTHHMNMDHSAWEGFEIDGHVDTVLSRGKVIVDDHVYLGAKGDGRFLKRGLSQYLT